jgi:hypothetical protein
MLSRERVDWRLAAVLAADIAGCSRFVGVVRRARCTGRSDPPAQDWPMTARPNLAVNPRPIEDSSLIHGGRSLDPTTMVGHALTGHLAGREGRAPKPVNTQLSVVLRLVTL